jgi:folate-binding protein YgfZ
MSDDTPPADGLSILVDLERDTLRARGSEATPWLNGLLSIDLRAVAPGRGAFGLLLTKTGKIQTDIDVLARPGELILGVGAGAGETVRAVLDAHLVMEDVELEPATDLAWLRLIGPGAAALASECASDFVAHGAIDWLGLGGAAAVVRRDEIDRVVRRLCESRTPGESSGARLLDRDGWDLLRLRHGFPLFGRDYGRDDNPHEAALDRRAVSWDKGCYLGQEVVCMQDMRGRVKRRLVVLRIDSSELPASDTSVVAVGTGEPVGAVRSAVRAADGRVLAFALLRAPHFEGGGASAAGAAPLSVAERPAWIVGLPAP